MGGEYLPAYLPAEVEIARICLRSTTSDVISLRARPTPEGIAYRVVNEYEADFFLPITTSKEPLTLEELVLQFEDGELEGLEYGGDLALGYNNMNAESCSFEDLRYFTRITSPIYRQLEQNFECVFEEWLNDSCIARDADDSVSSNSER